MGPHEKLHNQFSEPNKDGSADRDEAVNEAMRCLLQDLSELSRAVEQLEKVSELREQPGYEFSARK